MKIAVTLGFAPHQVRQWPHADVIALMAYDQVEPFGAVRDNWHMAVQAQLFCAANTAKGKRPPALDAFMYKDPGEVREQNARSFIDFLRSKKK